MKRPPTDREILRKIHKRYYNKFGNFKRGNPDAERETKIYVPIDCEAIAKDLGVDPDIVFGRLYYHLDKKYGYVKQDGSKVHLFAFAVGNNRNAVHFPLLSAVLADLEQSWFRFTAPFIISALALLISIITLLFTVDARSSNTDQLHCIFPSIINSDDYSSYFNSRR